MYMTIALELLEARKASPLPTLTVTAHLLKRIHEDWVSRLQNTKPAGSQLRSEALEMAIEELITLLDDSSPTEAHSPTE
jgi:hypothetical protein